MGRILEAIGKNGVADNTLVIFSNDSGGLTEEVNRPWLGTKNTTFEGDIRVPFIACWPGKFKPGATNDAMINVTDLFPTFVTLGGGSLKQALALDGLDMSAVMLEGRPSPRDKIVIEVSGSVRLPTLRKGGFKLVGKELSNLATDHLHGRRSVSYLDRKQPPVLDLC